VLAARLSEDPACEVTLLEVGPDLVDLPADVVDASGPSFGHDWGYVAEPDRLGRRIALPRAKLTGGCPATNGCFALRGAPADYEGWTGMGIPGWSFEEVLPFFRRLEADADFGDEWHSTDSKHALTAPERVAVHAPDQRERVPAHHDRGRIGANRLVEAAGQERHVIYGEPGRLVEADGASGATCRSR
jgi:choline dehydrogenase-like flavoprotein